MTASMTSFKAGDVIWVSFPHVENERSKVRPALVVSGKMVGPEDGLLWAMMITNALRPDWPGDLMITPVSACRTRQKSAQRRLLRWKPQARNGSGGLSWH
jgi:mRNA-degrading endonuclease toxin of MazEF toxin-antitoxin module